MRSNDPDSGKSTALDRRALLGGLAGAGCALALPMLAAAQDDEDPPLPSAPESIEIEARPISHFERGKPDVMRFGHLEYPAADREVADDDRRVERAQIRLTGQRGVELGEHRGGLQQDLRHVTASRQVKRDLGVDDIRLVSDEHGHDELHRAGPPSRRGGTTSTIAAATRSAAWPSTSPTT